MSSCVMQKYNVKSEYKHGSGVLTSPSCELLILCCCAQSTLDSLERVLRRQRYQHVQRGLRAVP